MSSIIRARSGLIFSCVMGTSCPIEKAQSSGSSVKLQNRRAIGSVRHASHERHCRESGLVLEPNPDSLSLWSSSLRHFAVTLGEPRRSVRSGRWCKAFQYSGMAQGGAFFDWRDVSATIRGHPLGRGNSRHRLSPRRLKV
jgi:hypothetical protein